jgi:hypothetical protein
MLALRSAFHDQNQALRLVEGLRWPDHVACPCCGGTSRIGRLGGSSTTKGSFKCYGCRRRFSVRTGTLLEGSHVSLDRWLRVTFLLSCATRHVGGKHVEEASSVAPRIARLLRRKLLHLRDDVNRSSSSHLSTRMVDWGCELATEEAATFGDLCKAVGIPVDTDGGAFIAAMEIILVQPSQTVRWQHVRAVSSGHMGLGLSKDWIFGPDEPAEMVFDRL